MPPADRALCEGSERSGTQAHGPGYHDVCTKCGGSYRVKQDGTLIKHRPTPRRQQPPTTVRP